MSELQDGRYENYKRLGSRVGGCGMCRIVRVTYRTKQFS